MQKGIWVDSTKLSTLLEVPVIETNMPALAQINQQLILSAAGSDDPEGYPIGFVWDFGDDSFNSTDIHPTHVYTASGFYTVILTATNAVGIDVALGTVQIVEEENKFIFLPTILTGMIPRE